MKYLVTLLILSLLVLNLESRPRTNIEPYSHFLSLYAGPNVAMGDWDFGFNAKLSWELRKESNNFGFGFFVETIFAKNLDFSFGFPFYFHNVFIDDLYLYLAPGLMFTKGINYTPPFMRPEDEAKTQVELFQNEYRGNFMLQFGAGWDFPLQSNGINFMLISPHLNLNLISQTKIYLNLGISASLIIR